MILLSGTRQWTDKEYIRWALEGFPRTTQFIHGGAKGLDTLAHEVATELGFPEPIIVRPEYDYWFKKIGKAGFKVAPNKRNVLMLEGKKTEEGSVDPSQIPFKVLAFFIGDKESGGTGNCVKEARKRNIFPICFHLGLTINV